MMRRKRMRFLTGLIVISLALNACIINRFRVGPTQTDSQTIEVGDAESVNVDIKMGIGEIEIAGGASDLLEAEFTYNVDELEPEVDYSVSGSSGRLRIQHETVEGLPVGDYDDVRSEWNLSFDDRIPSDMVIDLGAARGDLDLRGFSISSLDLEIGAGDANLWLGDSPLRNLDIEVGAGNLTLDLTGEWERDLSAEISGGVGQLTFYLPSDVGVIVDVEMGIASVDISGLHQDGSTYTNNAYPESEVTLRLNIEGGVGSIRLEVRD